MDITHMKKRDKITLFHLLEWICFWWENQSECDWEGGEKTQDYCEEFARHWWSMEKDAYEGADAPDTVNYSAAVYCQDISEEEACRDTWRRLTSDKLSHIITEDYKFFTKVSGLDADDFLPYWFG